MLVLAEIGLPNKFGVAETTRQEVHGRLEPVVGVLDLFRCLWRPHITVVRRISCIEVGHELRVGIDDGLEEGPVLMRVPRVDVQLALTVILEVHLLAAMQLWRHGQKCRQSCIGHGEPIDIEAILVVYGGKIFERLSGHAACPLF